MPPYIDIAPLSNRESNSAAHTGKGRMNAIGGLCLPSLAFSNYPYFLSFYPTTSNRIKTQMEPITINNRIFLFKKVSFSFKKAFFF